MIPVLKPHSQTFLLLHSDILLLPDMLTLHRVSFTQRSVVGRPFCHCLVLLLFYNTFIFLSAGRFLVSQIEMQKISRNVYSIFDCVNVIPFDLRDTLLCQNGYSNLRSKHISVLNLQVLRQHLHNGF